MIYDLPTSLEVSGVIYEIRSDYRYALDILIALNDPLLSDEQKIFLHYMCYIHHFVLKTILMYQCLSNITMRL